MTSIIKGSRLRPGQTIGIIAPASPISQSDISQGLKLVESLPSRIRLAPHLYDHLDYLAGYDHDRVSDLHEMFSDPDIKAILCARGGYGSARLLNKIDFELVRKNPKILVGFSDLTALLMALFARTGLITIHGPTLSELPKANNSEKLHKLITTDDRPEIFFRETLVIHSGTATGILLGGNLSTLCSLMGTPFLPSFDGAILFLEERGEAPYRVDRMLTHLLLSGRLDRLSGLVMGQFEACGDKDVLHRLLTERLRGLNIPVITGLPVGHGPENASLPLGLPARLDTGKMLLRIEESCTH